MARRSLPLSRVYQLIEPGPVVLVSTLRGGKPNVMTMSWHMMVEFEPPLIACVISDRNYSFEAIRKTKECVINIPTAELAEKVVACGNSSGAKTDKFKKFGLSAVAAEEVKAPLIAECYANLECRVIDAGLVNKYGIFILEVVKAWIDRSQNQPKTMHHRGNGVFAIDGDIIKLRSGKK